MTRALIALGSNLPFEGVSGQALLARAVAALASAGFAPRARSSVWETPAWPPSAQPNFVNAAAELDCAGLAPQQLYEELRKIEARFGRARRERWGPRTLDLDILAMDGWIGAFGDVIVPHPRLHERGFVLAPLAEIAADWRHPVLGMSVAEMLARLPRGPGGRRLGPLEG